MIPQNAALVKSKYRMNILEIMFRVRVEIPIFPAKSGASEHICAHSLTETKIQFYELQKKHNKPEYSEKGESNV